MDIRNIPVPEVYKSSKDFRIFIDWFAEALSEIQYNTEHLSDIYDPLRCKSDLLWMLGDTMGYTLDDRLPIAFNRLVILYFMSLIRNKGSKDGVTLAAELNLAQFGIQERVNACKIEGTPERASDILYDRLEDTSIPVNSVSVTPHTDEGYIDIVYFATKVPLDACIEYVRPVGMYAFQRAGVKVDARSKISVDARLADESSIGLSIGATRVGCYSREDYARIQKMHNVTNNEDGVEVVDASHSREAADLSNLDASKRRRTNAGFRALSSLQLCNNDHILQSILGKEVFSLGYGPQANEEDVSTYDGDTALKNPKPWNLRVKSKPILKDSRHYAYDPSRTDVRPTPVVNEIMSTVGDALFGAADNKTDTTKK